MDKTEAAKRSAADVADEIARGARAAASWRIFVRWLSLRHGARACHSEFVTANAAVLLLQHYVDNFRHLPWRSPPGEAAPEPYRVWLSEVMLQQTTVASVIPRFERFVERWPTIEALAAANDEEVLSEWAGLGYYARARNLIACAREVVREGGFPARVDKLKELPGIGSYTSAAIAAIAFGERAPAVDTNVERVIARLNGLQQVRRPEIEQRLLAMMVNGRPGDVVQAMMDLGATICRPRKPDCLSCPLRGECTAFRSGSPDGFPTPKQPRSRPQRFGVAYWTECDGNVWLVRRPETGPLAKMAALPGSEWMQAPVAGGDPIGTIHHVFTHFSLDLDVVFSAEPLGDGWWHPVKQIGRAGLPTLYRKAADLVLIREERDAA